MTTARRPATGALVAVAALLLAASGSTAIADTGTPVPAGDETAPPAGPAPAPAPVPAEGSAEDSTEDPAADPAREPESAAPPTEEVPDPPGAAAITITEHDLLPALVAEDEEVTWSYLVTNTGEVAVTGIAVTDSAGATITCPDTSLEPGFSMICTARSVLTTN